MLKTICILGGGGQLGTKIITEFSKYSSVKIVAIDKIFNERMPNKNIEYIELNLNKGDFTALKKLPKSNLVFINCVGLQHALAAKKISEVNFNLNKSVYDFIANNFNLFHYIYISSLSVRNDSQDNLVPGVGNPINLYGKSKLQMEEYLGKQKRVNSDITILRPAAFYDRSLSKNLENFFDLLINKVFVLPIKNKKRSFLSLEYFVKYLFLYCNEQSKRLQCIDLEKKDINIYEIGDSESIEFNTLIRKFRMSGLDVNSRIFKIPTFLFKYIGKTGYILENMGIHIDIFIILGEFAYNFEVQQGSSFEELTKENTYDNFLKIANNI